MSRGPGIWQRAVLKELEQRPAFYVADLLPDKPTASHRAALSRACVKLRQQGQVRTFRLQDGTPGGRTTIVYRTSMSENAARAGMGLPGRGF